MQHKHEAVRQVLLEGLHEMYERGIPDYAIIHFYLNCDWMDQTFMLIGAGRQRKTLKQLRLGDDLDIIID